MNVTLSQHAIQRYMERVRPGLDFPAAKIELRLLIDRHGQQREPPAALQARPADAWVSIGDDVWLPCKRHGDRLVAQSVLCRGHEREGAGRHRRIAKRKNLAARHGTTDLENPPSGAWRRPSAWPSIAPQGDR